MAVARKPDGSIEEVAWHVRGRRGEPRVALRFALVDDRIECVRVEIGARLDNPREPDPRPLTTADLRRVNLGRMITDAKTARARGLAKLRKEGRWPKETREGLEHALLEARASLLRRDPRTVADVYRKAMGRGDRKPTQAVADHFGISPSAAGKLVWKARHEFGLLPETSQGKASARRRGSGRRSR